MKIKLSQGKYATVDKDDHEWLSQWKWHVSKDGYARRNICKNKKWNTIWMHRLINDTPEGLDTDHINRNKLDNRRKNLISATRSQNKLNGNAHKDNKTGIKGVSWNKIAKKWVARICVNYKDINIGFYETFEEAVIAREEVNRLFR